MRMPYWQDAGLKIRNAIFTLGSCGLSGYAGWLLATDVGWLVQCITASLFACIAYSLSESVVAMTRYRLAKDKEGYYRNLVMAVALLFVNILTDYSASVTLRDFSMAASGNQNANAKNARGEVKRIESRIEALTKSREGVTITYRPPKAYEGLIIAKREEMRQESLRGCRTPPCRGAGFLEDSQELAGLISTQASAKELADLRKALPIAKAAVKDTPQVGNPAVAPIIGLLNLLTQSLEHKSSTVQHGLNHFLLVITLGISWAIWFLSAEIGTRAGPMTAPIPYEPREKPDYWGERALPAPSNYEPIPLKAESLPMSGGGGATSTTSVTMNYTGSSPPSVERLNAMIAQLEAKRNTT